MDPVYIASATSKGGRMGHVRSSDGFIDMEVNIPAELGGPGDSTNPEQLFAAGYASCFLSALGLLAAKREIDTSEATVTASIGLGPTEKGFVELTAELVVRMPGVERETAEKLVSRAHEVCPYSRATRGNIESVVRVEDA